jgi:hypothetical protein
MPQRKARRTQRETTWYQGVASRETRVERGWVMRGLLPWSRVAEEVSAVAVAVQAKWVSYGVRAYAARRSNKARAARIPRR